MGDDPSFLENWIEIAFLNRGGDIGANPCYISFIFKNIWNEQVEGSYSLQFHESEHSQGATKYLLVELRREDGKNIYCEIIVNEEGLVTLTTYIPFDATLLISNLSGNVKLLCWDWKQKKKHQI